jgi:hypothetical protein
LAFFAVLLAAGSTFCTGFFACFGALRAAPPFARRFGLRARAVLDGLGSFFFRRSSISRSFFASFLRLFSSFARFLSLLLSRFFEATLPPSAIANHRPGYQPENRTAILRAELHTRNETLRRKAAPQPSLECDAVAPYPETSGAHGMVEERSSRQRSERRPGFFGERLTPG